MKFIISAIKEEENRNVLSVELASRPACKTCGIHERREGSSYCIECANLYNINHN